jgi:hypothetical protein
MVDGDPWFRAKDIATVLGYANTTQAVLKNVDNDDRRKMKELVNLPERLTLDYHTCNTIFINEAGLYSLILRSEKPEAKTFKAWVTKEVLPSIRKTGGYTVEQPPPPLPSPLEQISIFDRGSIKRNKSFYMITENDLHRKVVDYIRNFHPEAKMTAGLGEFQSTSSLRVEGYRKGYQKGTADLMILNKHLDYSGLCLEFKNPKGSGHLSEAQEEWLKELHLNGYKVLVSNDYDEIVQEIKAYFVRVRVACPYCLKKPNYFKSLASMQQHISNFHHNLKPAVVA